MAGRIARGDVCLYRFARPDKRRPVVVLTRDSAIRYPVIVTLAPVTSTTQLQFRNSGWEGERLSSVRGA